MLYGFPSLSLPNGLCQARPPIVSRYSRIAKSWTDALVNACYEFQCCQTNSEEQGGNPQQQLFRPHHLPYNLLVFENMQEVIQFLQDCNFGLFACSLVLGLVRCTNNRLYKAACYRGQKGKMLQMHRESLEQLKKKKRPGEYCKLNSSHMHRH